MAVAKKIFVLIISSLVFIISVGSIGYFNMNQMVKHSTAMYKDNLLPIKYMNDLRAQSRANEALVLGLMLTTDSSTRDSMIEQIKERGENSINDINAYKSTNLSDYEKQTLTQIEAAITKIQTEREKLYPIIYDENVTEAYHFYKQNLSGPISELNKISEELADYNEKAADDLQKDIKNQETSATILMITIIIASAVLAFILGMIISRMLTKPIKEIVSAMEKAEHGDLTIQGNYQSKDEIGQLTNSFNQMIASTQKAIAEVAGNSTSLAASAEEISASTEEIASGAQMQAQDANTSNEMVKDLTFAIHEISKNAELAAQLSEKTVGVAEHGNIIINDAVGAMENITVSIHDLANKSLQIGEIIDVIDDIAEQTNLLALNAAIEAARAGDAGKGFAVVADEVRKLAERSSKATKEISDLITVIQDNTKLSVQAVELGNTKAATAGTSFVDIMKVVKESATKITEIAAASEEGAAQAQEMLIAVQNIASVTEESAAGIEETASTATDLAHMAESLNELASRFKI